MNQYPVRLREFYQSGESHLFLAIAGNPNTPLDILESLCELRQVSRAHFDRRIAKENLDRQEA